jgi:ABC-type glucose/galactose transport system permease subunit
LLAEESAQALLYSSLVLFLRLLVNFIYLAVAQAILLHQLNEVEIVLPELPRLQISRAILVFVLLTHAVLPGLVLPVQKVAPDGRS